MKKEKFPAVSDPRAHFGVLAEAIDFLMPEGTPLLAVKAGIVWNVKVDSKEGGAGKKYRDLKYLNYLTIKHSNGEFSQYAHLKYKGSLVKIGDKVKKGQKIAFSGNTGWSTEPHLHFHVFKLLGQGPEWVTLKVRFSDRVYVRRKFGE